MTGYNHFNSLLNKIVEHENANAKYAIARMFRDHQDSNQNHNPNMHCDGSGFHHNINTGNCINYGSGFYHNINTGNNINHVSRSLGSPTLAGRPAASTYLVSTASFC